MIVVSVMLANRLGRLLGPPLHNPRHIEHVFDTVYVEESLSAGRSGLAHTLESRALASTRFR